MVTTQQRDGSRLPNPQQLVPELGEIGAALFKATGNGTIPRSTIGLIQLRAGQLVGSTYLAILHAGNLRTAGETEERIAAVETWRDAPLLHRRRTRRARPGRSCPAACRAQ